MNAQAWDLLKTILITLLSSGSVTALITRYFEKHNRVHAIEERIEDITKVVDRQGDAIEKLLRSNMELLNLLHDKNVINGESQKLREGFADYLYTSQAKGFKVKERKKA